MRVVHIIVGLDFGGAEFTLCRLLKEFAKRPAQIHIVISLTTVGKVGDFLLKDGVEVYSLGMKTLFDVFSSCVRLYRLLQNLQPDLVQTWLYHADFMGGAMARLAGVRYVIWGVHSTYLNSGVSVPTRLLRFLCAGLSYVIPYAVVCVAEATRSMHRRIGYDGRRLIVIPNGFDCGELAPSAKQRHEMRQIMGVLGDDIIVGSVGRFNSDKDPENFIRAAGLLASRYSNIRFIMIGRHLDTDNVRLNGWIKGTGHADRFVLMGERSDVPSCLAAMDIYCLHSRTEAFPLVVGEAMAVGLPCVVTDVGDTALLLGGNGIVVPKENAKALADGVAEMVMMGEEARIAIGQRGKMRVLAEYNIDRMCQGYEDIYVKALKGEPL